MYTNYVENLLEIEEDMEEFIPVANIVNNAELIPIENSQNIDTDQLINTEQSSNSHRSNYMCLGTYLLIGFGCYCFYAIGRKN